MNDTRPDPLPRMIIDALAAHYPVFRQPLPLALNTRQRTAEMAALSGLTIEDIHYAVKIWTRLDRYQNALAAPGAMRYSLEGEPVEPVTTGDQKGATLLMAHRKRLAKDRKAKDRKAAPVPEPEPPAPVPEPEPVKLPARPMLKLKPSKIAP